MNNGTDRFTIGQLARRTGLRSRTIRFWSDQGVIPPVARSAGGYRLYDAAAIQRLDLVRTLRELGLGLDEVRQVLDRQSSLANVAETHIRAIDAEMRALRLSRAVLRAVVNRGCTTKEIALMHKLAQLSARERQQIIDDFVRETFAGVDNEDAMAVADLMREMPPELPDDPTAEQVDAWVELAELVGDEGFQHTIRQLVLSGARDYRIDFGLTIRPVVIEHAGGAIKAGVGPESGEGREVLDRIVPRDLPGDEVATLLDWVERVAKPELERYWELLNLINGYSPGEPGVPAFHWLAAALRAHRCAVSR
ncbi:MerR family transcriptional regulator [Kibdelosporangium philippinense]|uniref:MerR family transcriptional regulator n=1 Tax=Kibdelosporangium philippinense TaxID=211113 RepID=A0ABS8Z632_9PSEU|nr:MerR family transcriptional regulator [Kibdelosporangium philippinense]MCE7003344.1 MerR family transcriptional regulator [Kibdelosporangium philippinense]